MRKFLHIVLLLMAAGCSPAAKISVVETGSSIINGMTSVHGKALVDSRAGKTVLIENADLVFRYKTRRLASGRLIRPIEIPAGEISRVRYDLALVPVSLPAVQTLLSRMEVNPAQVFVDATAWVRYGNIRRRVEIKNVSYSEIMLNFDPEKMQLP